MNEVIEKMVEEKSKEISISKNSKDKFIFIGLFILLAFAIFLLLYLVFTIPAEATACLSDPLVYIQEKTNSFCSCSYQITKFLN